jgi:two-component system response regulator FlrC
MSKPCVLIVEDDRELREALCMTLQIAGLNYIEADCAENALLVLEKKHIDIVVSDVNMPGMDGHQLLSQVQTRLPGMPMMLITAYGQIQNAVDAMQSGASDYLVKPFEPQILIESIQRIVGVKEHAKSQQPIAEDPSTKRFFQVAKKVAGSESTVMIAGESGTGKEVLARYIHNNSPRKNKPFVAINCAAIPENMLEAMLFGHEKGAFTGAYASSPGKFEQADGGTLLLDEISEMDLGLQAKLLRVLQEREVERVGGKKPIPVDVRILATTNRELKSYVEDRKFREDLYYRLSVFPMTWKPLRERKKDILPIANRLLDEHSTKMKRGEMLLGEGCTALLESYHWPGNVRELDNAIQRALILASGQQVSPDDFFLDMSLAPSITPLATNHVSPANVDAVLAELNGSQKSEGEFASTQAPQFEEDKSELGKDLKMREYKIIIETLRQENGKKKLVAERLGISPRTLRYKLAQMRESGIDVAAEVAA